MGKHHMKEIANPRLTITNNIPINYNPDKQNLYVVFGSVNQIKMLDLERASQWIKNGAITLITSPDIADPSAKGDNLIGMPGHMLHMLKQAAPTRAYNTGKPNPLYLEKLSVYSKKYLQLLKTMKYSLLVTH